MIRHAGLVALRCAGGWRGALIEGPSGSGKSDLALRALELGFRLVADDRARVWTCEGRLYGACPAPIAGLIEQRGRGVVSAATRPLVEIRLLVLCQAATAPIERMPEPETLAILDLPLPVLRLHALEASAPVKLREALSHVGA